jgi:hypothetical protein
MFSTLASGGGSMLNKTTAIGAFVMALANLIAAFGIVLPAYATAPAIALINGAALAVVAAISGVRHIMESKSVS